MNLFELSAMLVLNKTSYDKGLDDAEKKADKSGVKIGEAFGKMAKVSAKAFGAAVAAVGALGKKSVDAFAEFQQLSGGIQKLYGNMGKDLETFAKDTGRSVDDARGEWQKLEDAQNLVMKNARQGFKTTGLSANEYMKSVTGFSAALINSLEGDTKKAAAAADVAMRDIADNANTFGKYSVQELTEVYQALAKGQYQTLDNLNLGFGGTKEGMQQLIDKANELGKAQGLNSDLTIDSYADIVEAIHRVQGELNITNTTQNEAAKTIEGSINMTKAAWQNLMEGFADPDADLKSLIKDVVDSAKIAAGNLIPAFTQALSGIAYAIGEIGPLLFKEVPKLITDLAPPLLTAGATLLAEVLKAIPATIAQVVQMFTDHRGDFVQGVQMIYDSIIEFINDATSNADSVLTPFIQMVLSIIDIISTTAWEHLPDLIAAATNILVGITSWISEHLGDFTVVAIEILTSMANGLVESIPIILDAIPKVIESLLNAILEYGPQVLEMGIYIIETLALGLLQNLPKIIDTSAKILQKIPETISKHLPEIIATGIRIVTQLGIGLIQALPSIIKAAGSLIKALFAAFTGADWITIGKNVIKGIVRGLKDAGHMIKDFLLNLMKGAVDGVKKFFGIHSPSRKMRDEVGKRIPEGMALGIKDKAKAVADAMDELEEIPKDVNVGINGSTSPGGSNIGASTKTRGSVSELVELLKYYLPRIENSQIVLDTGALVGQTAPAFDQALGQIYTEQVRLV